MPVYTYRREDGTTFEVRQKFTDAPLTTDPESGAAVVRVVHAAGIIFKGSGFYINDSKDASKKGITSPASANTNGATTPAADSNGAASSAAASTDSKAADSGSAASSGAASSGAASSDKPKELSPIPKASTPA
jgi:putative FmdB family regulatory protein